MSLSPLHSTPQSFYSQRWRPSDAEEELRTAKTSKTAPWRLSYSRRLSEAAVLGAPRRPFADLLPGGHRGPVRAAAFSSSGLLSTGGADRRIRLWDLRCNSNRNNAATQRPCAASGELLAASAPLPGSVRCLAAGCGLLVSGSGVDARLAVWRQRRRGGGEVGEEEEQQQQQRREEEEEEEEDEDSEFDNVDDESDLSLSSSDSDSDSNSDSRRLCAATRRLLIQENDRRRRKNRQQAAAAAATASASASASASTKTEKPLPPPPFDISTPPTFLSGHAGPVAAVSIEEGLVYSASWDMTVRVWDPDRKREEDEEEAEREREEGGRVGRRGGERNKNENSTTLAPASPTTNNTTSSHCVGVVHLCDWGWSVSRRAGRLLVAEGRGAAVFDADRGEALLRVAPSEADKGRRGDAARVEGTRDGRTLFVARADGSLESVDLRSEGGGSRMKKSKSGTTALLLPGGPPPSGLAFDDPWIALASGRGGVALLDARKPRAALASFSAAKGKSNMETTATATTTTTAKPALPIPRPPRRLGWSSNAAVRCVEISGTWVVAGCDDGSVRTWWFGGGGEGDGGGGGGKGGRRRRR